MGNKWIEHLKQVRKENPEINDIKKLAKKSKESYKK